MTDRDELARTLRRVVFTDKLLSVEDARRYCDIVGLPHTVLAEK